MFEKIRLKRGESMSKIEVGARALVGYHEAQERDYEQAGCEVQTLEVIKDRIRKQLTPEQQARSIKLADNVIQARNRENEQ
jgi:hypothetical protein